MSNRVSEIIKFLRQHVRTDRGELVQKLVERFPQVTGPELQAAIDSRRPVLVLTQERADVPD